MKNRISEWRERRGLTVESLAAAVDTSPGQISRLQNGSRRLDTDWLDRLAKALQCKPLDLVSNSIPEAVPVVGKVGAGAMVYPIDDYLQGGAAEFVEVPPGVDFSQNLVALKVEGDSLEPMLYEGWYVYYNTRIEGGCEDMNSKVPHVVRIKDGATLVKLIRRGYARGKYNLHSYKPGVEIIEDVTIEWCAKIVSIKPV